jgi:hypothetical protein
MPICRSSPMPSSSALIPMSTCASQCLFSHSFTTYEWLNSDCDVQIYIGIKSRWTGYWSVEDTMFLRYPKQITTVSVGSVLKWRTRSRIHYYPVHLPNHLVDERHNCQLSWIRCRWAPYINLFLFFPAAGATKNLRRFGQSIKRVVREVKEDSGGIKH